MNYKPGDLLIYKLNINGSEEYILEFISLSGKETFKGKLVKNTYNSTEVGTVSPGYSLSDFVLYESAINTSDLVDELFNKLDKLY